ncbi:hypothetical protein [Vibrio ruber]|uniref:hypothetical protein n=1 Tax=Vibrio ruber TaxID=184755 RepID=UPI0009845E42|nr:hypothetical protein [Vibrio ruber]
MSVAEQLSQQFPLNLSLTTMKEAVTEQDLQDLKKKGLITWDLTLKVGKTTTPVSNPEHMVVCVAYYGDGIDGYYCAGYALGCISKDNSSLEINFIEKRKDASTDLCYQFLPIMIEAFTAYGLYLNQENMSSVDKIVLVGPIDGVKKYYKDQGFKLVSEYYKGEEAMIKSMDK